MEDIQDRKHKVKDLKDCVRVEQGDIMKFGRVRFRIKKLVVTDSSKSTKSGLNKLDLLKIDQVNSSNSAVRRLSELSMGAANDTALNSRRSTEGGMDYMIRMHSSANYSFDMQKANLDDEDDIDNDPLKKEITENKSMTDNQICRICLSEEEFPDHELIIPCKCTGSLGHIGLSCLKEWLEGKRLPGVEALRIN